MPARDMDIPADTLPERAAVRAEAARLLERFLAAGAQPVETEILQPAGTLLDLYGEDIRARAYVTADPLEGEMMLRPDFTVPVVQMHMAGGAEPARYAYAGEVFRRQEHHGARAREYFQAGFELFARDDTEAADAEVFALFAEMLAPLGLRAATGDIGILRAAVEGLSTSPARKAALLRHIWRPRRFRALLDRFGGRVPPNETRKRLIASLGHATPEELMASAGPMIGLREPGEIAARARALAQDAAEPPLSGSEVETLDDVLGLRGTAPVALAHLRDVAVDLPAIGGAVERLARRLDALAARGIDVETLEFEASHGRSTLEYYDGFVFSFVAEARPDLPPVATGGRYDALTRVLGQGREIPAVGGVIRPGLVVALREGIA
ncbi:ATP phosphoribosyltransferase regulatory subunit [Acidimangrovimonas sediminis]|uniref:ATP phosphoribosyltransferase regulatory subunit n=1 Tax=Acidimangrovimonas sediminis TaxID=2056283 RepID=UPI001E447415|nr:ATP phosphoribosyltransferase regulatory subunit [Acidimangrovimonas sediminis]